MEYDATRSYDMTVYEVEDAMRVLLYKQFELFAGHFQRGKTVKSNLIFQCVYKKMLQ